MKVWRWAATAVTVGAVSSAIWLITSSEPSKDDTAAVPRSSVLQVAEDHAGGVCVLMSHRGLEQVRGAVQFHMHGAQVEIAGRIEGLSPGRYRFFVAEFGDLRGDHDSFGNAYFRLDWPMSAGGASLADLMTFDVDDSGVAVLDQLNPAMALYGPESIIGRAFVIYDAASSPEGAHVAAGVIGRLNQSWTSLPSTPFTAHSTGGTDQCG